MEIFVSGFQEFFEIQIVSFVQLRVGQFEDRS